MWTRARRTGSKMAAVVVGVAVVVTTVVASPAQASDDEPTLIPWSSLLPSFTTGYQPSSANDCTSGKLRCVDAVIREMERRYDPLLDRCDHNAMFALTYLRTTEQYRRSVVEPGFFSDPRFINHQDAVFARYYFEAWDAYRSGDLAGTPPAWQTAFAAADGKKVSGLGNMMLGMSAHVNRDLPMVLAEIGLVKPDGSSRKPDHDKVNAFLNLVMTPLLAEAGARLDPTVDDVQLHGTDLDEIGIMQLIMGWREQAWRNAEALVNAPTPAARALVQASIETTAAIEAQLIVVATSYSPLSVQQALGQLGALLADPAAILQAQLDRTVNQLRGVLGTLFTPGATLRDRHCAANA